MDANVRFATNGLPQFIQDGMAELTHGIDEAEYGKGDRKDEITELAMNPESLRKALDLTKLNNGHQPAYAGGYIFLRYIAKQFSSRADSSSLQNATKLTGSNLPTGISVKGEILTASTEFAKNSIDLSDYSSTIKKIDATALSKDTNIYAALLNTSIKSGKGSDKIFGGAGNDSIYGNDGNDVLYGGAGNDVFIYRSGQGNDVITDYTAQDKISITGGTYTKSTVGNDIKLKVGTGSILLKNAKN